MRQLWANSNRSSSSSLVMAIAFVCVVFCRLVQPIDKLQRVPRFHSDARGDLCQLCHRASPREKFVCRQAIVQN